jgi:hypothetical protein
LEEGWTIVWHAIKLVDDVIGPTLDVSFHLFCRKQCDVWVNIIVNAKIGLAHGHIFVTTSSSATFVKRTTRTHPDRNIPPPRNYIPKVEYNHEKLV